VAREGPACLTKEADVTIATRVEQAVPDQAVPVETPFLEVYEGPIGYEDLDAPEATMPETPFLTEYQVGDEVVSESAGAFRDLLSELYDTEFDEALLELADEADARAQLLGLDEAGADQARVERALEQWIEPLRMEAEALLERMGDALDSGDPRSMTETELDEMLDSFEPQETTQGPVFEDFLKKLWKKAKSAVKGAVNLAKKGIAAVGKILPIGIILKKLKALVRPLLQQVLKLALNRLPPALRPAAAQLARRFLGTRELEAMELGEEEDEAMESPASTDVRALQLNFDTEVAALFLAPAEPEQEAMLAEAAFEADRLEDSSIADLDQAREAFVERLMELEEGEDPTPVIEQFVPAILMALRVGIRIIGRPKVVAFLAKFLGRLIAPYVGRNLTAPLSQAIVDAGLRLMTLEAGEEEAEADPRIAAEAFAALVEDTVARVAELEDEELEEEAIVEEATFEGFHRGARRQFPAAVLRGAIPGRASGVWIGMPRRGRRRYRKYSRLFDVTISPEAAAAIRIRGGRTLATFLKDRLGRTGAVRARIHLYRAIPGTRLGRIARAERSVAGLGPGAVAAQTEMHPLTREAAGALLGEPELGEDVSEAFLDELAPPAVGQAFYYLEVAGGRPAATGTPIPGRTVRPRLSTTTAAIDIRRGELVLAIYLGETQAQAIAARLRRNEPIGAILSALRAVYLDGVRALASGAGRRRLRIIGETTETSGETTGEAGTQAFEEQLLGIPGLPSPTGLVGKLLARWTRRAMATELRQQRDAFVTAASAPQDGVTLMLRLAQPPGLAALAQLIRGRIGAGLRNIGALRNLLKAKPAGARLEIVPGFRRA
jgi:hypothetical protein